MAEQPVYMLNVLWFKEEGGRETYGRYAQAAAPVIGRLGGRLLDAFNPEQALIGDWDPDLFFVVEWPSWEAFQALVDDEDYRRDAMPLREEALERSLLIRCSRADFG
ncbi:MAG: DUF1330 domain-containing protein [Acidobacteriota bacterium]